MLAILNSLNAHNIPICQPILIILISEFMVYRALSDKAYLLLGLLSRLIYKNGGHLKNGRHLGYYAHLHVMSDNYKCFIVKIDTSTNFKEKFIAK